MRVIGGKYRRRVLRSPTGAGTRPMLDRMRETLFNILQFEIEGVVFADLFAGTGAVGIEALSRGAKKAFFVERDVGATRVIAANLAELGAESDAVVVRSSVEEALPRLEADIWFVGPPYHDLEAYETALLALAEKDCRLVVTQHDRRTELAENYGALERYRAASVGANVLSFYRPASS